MAIKRGWYKHFKGEYYYVIGIATHTETNEKMVVYHRKNNPSELYVRPASMWLESVNGEPRFKFISNDMRFDYLFDCLTKEV